MPQKYTLSDLIHLMARLREPDTGCPWDLAQTYRTITASTIEEAYEVVDAIDRDDYEHLKEELGDLLFQVVFYSQLASEEGRWNFDDVASAITSKLVRRHPHVFPDGTLASRRSSVAEPEQATIKQNWEAIKQQERAEKGKLGLLDDVPRALPAVIRAEKLQKRVAKVGFDWPDHAGVIDKIREELAEVEQAIASKDAAHIEEELGDLLFTCVNLTRHCRISSEQALRAANQKFENRFAALEADLVAQGLSPEAASEAQLESAWERVKRIEKGAK